MKHSYPIAVGYAPARLLPSKAPIKARRADHEQTGPPARSSADTHAWSDGLNDMNLRYSKPPQDYAVEKRYQFCLT